MYRIAIPLPRKAIPVPRINEDRNPRPRRPNHNPERAVEAVFAVMTIVILGMIIGLGAYTVLSVIPAWQKSHSPRNLEYPLNVEFESRSAEHR